MFDNNTKVKHYAKVELTPKEEMSSIRMAVVDVLRELIAEGHTVSTTRREDTYTVVEINHRQYVITPELTRIKITSHHGHETVKHAGELIEYLRENSTIKYNVWTDNN